MRRLGRTVRRGGRVAAIGCACAAAWPAPAPAQSAPYADWPSLLPAFPVPFTPNLEPDCKDGSDSCIERTIVEMQRRLDNVVGTCSHNAVFSLAYLRVTEDVRDASKAGVFQDRVWLAQEDAVFARMYFEAYDRWASGERQGVPEAWLLALDAARDRKVNGLGNFLMAMNAHINRDFPYLLAAIGITKPDGTTRKPDHDAYNSRLAALYQPVLKEVADRFDPSADDIELGPVDDSTAYLILQSWREGVWRNAERLLLAPNAAARAQVEREIELMAAGVARTLQAMFAADPAVRDAWCAEHGGQKPADATAAPATSPGSSRAGTVRLRLPRKALRLTSRRLRIPVACPRGAGSCRGTLTVQRPRGRGIRLGRAPVRLAAGRTTRVTVRIGPKARRALARDRGRARLILRRSGVTKQRAVTRRSLRVRLR